MTGLAFPCFLKEEKRFENGQEWWASQWRTCREKLLLCGLLNRAEFFFLWDWSKKLISFFNLLCVMVCKFEPFSKGEKLVVCMWTGHRRCNESVDTGSELSIIHGARPFVTRTNRWGTRDVHHGRRRPLSFHTDQPYKYFSLHGITNTMHFQVYIYYGFVFQVSSEIFQLSSEMVCRRWAMFKMITKKNFPS